MDFDMYPTIRMSKRQTSFFVIDRGECSVKQETIYLSIEVVKRRESIERNSFFVRLISKSSSPPQYITLEEEDLRLINELLNSLKEATK